MVSSETELPFDYYSLPFCLPPEGVRSSVGSINPGTILMGARIQNSPYNFTVKVSLLTAVPPTRACKGMCAGSFVLVLKLDRHAHSTSACGHLYFFAEQ